MKTITREEIELDKGDKQRLVNLVWYQRYATRHLPEGWLYSTPRSVSKEHLLKRLRKARKDALKFSLELKHTIDRIEKV